MNISTLNTSNIDQIRHLPGLAEQQGPNEIRPLEKGAKGEADRANISSFGMVNNYLASLSETEQQEVKSYMEGIREQRANGTFDIQASIDNAPEAIKDLAKQLNLGTEDVLHMMPKQAGGAKAAMRAEGEAHVGVSAYTDVAVQAENTSGDKSIFDVFSSWFSSDEEPVA